MLTKQVLREIAEARQTDAQQLFHALRYDGAVYLVGDWSIVTTWAPEARYQPVGQVDSTKAQSMIESVRNLLGVL